jgi:hypothetical protein
LDQGIRSNGDGVKKALLEADEREINRVIKNGPKTFEASDEELGLLQVRYFPQLCTKKRSSTAGQRMPRLAVSKRQGNFYH